MGVNERFVSDAYCSSSMIRRIETENKKLLEKNPEYLLFIIHDKKDWNWN